MKREKIYEEILYSMPKNLNDLELAAYINLKMVQYRDFSEKYYWGNKVTRNKIYSLACIDRNNKLQDKKQLICVTSCKLYEYLCAKFGIETYYQGDSGNYTTKDFSLFNKR